MNNCLTKTQNENNGKFNYFKLLVDKDLINLSTDLVEARIKPKFGKFNSSFEFLNNIINYVITKKLLFNFSRNVRDIKYNKMKNNFENLIKFNRPLFQDTLLEEIKEALDNTKLSIPTKCDAYFITTDFDSNLVGDISKHLLFDCYLGTHSYMTPKKYKKWVLEQIKNYLSNKETWFERHIINSFIEAFDYREFYFKNTFRLPITVSFFIRYNRINKTKNRTHNNKLLLLLNK